RAEPRAATPAGRDARPQQTDSGPRPYADVVRGTTPDSGLFIVHVSDEKLLFEIPDSLFGRDMLVISSIAGVPPEIAGFVVSGHKVQEQVWRWERRGKRVMLRRPSYSQVAADTTPIAVSVEQNNFPPVVAAFDVEAESGDSAAAVIDVTEFYEGDTPALSGLSQPQRRDYGVRRLDPERSFIVFARSFPRNVDVRHTLTYDATEPPGNNPTGTISIDMHQTMVLLPAQPMRPRLADERVGYFTLSRVNFGLPEQKAAEERFIRRWRLEPSDSAAYERGELVEPLKPIVYYLDPATPTEWRACVRQGVEDWQAAFETAGFRNAILARDAPARAEDPEWDMGDVRYSVVRWAASMVRNAMGPSVSDPRSGEIIESDIVWYHNHMRSYRNRLMLETGAANPLVRDLPIDDGMMCEAIRQVIAHEVGHALGLPHNMISSSAYPVEKLRDPTFADSMGVAPSIMDYARQNYIAQPGDGLRDDDFIRQIGPYDHYAVNWGYRVIPDAATPESEKATLNGWIVSRADDPVYRYLPQSASTAGDPRAQTEDLGDDAVAASGYGIANLRRVIGNLLDWTTDPGRDYADLEELYGELVAQWSRYAGHVANLIGGVHVDLKTADQPGAVYDGVPRARQEQAIAFLAREVFEAPTWLNELEILSRIGGSGFEQLSRRQAAVLATLLDARRLARMADLEVSQPGAYPLAAYLGDLRDAVWGALAVTARDPYRRALQRAYIEELEQLMTEEPEGMSFLGPAPDVSRSDIRPLARAQLRGLRAAAQTATAQTPAGIARAHLEDIVDRIDRILEVEAR
ncbi:MAG: zinc-dependent metalloprotease, partial [Longimicrobiales bacterium]